jgi:hypothetical protein
VTVADYEVGYGRPPKHSQFKAGKSGNKAGRPPKPKFDDVMDITRNALDATIDYREKGRVKTKTRSELGWKKIIDKAVHGDLRAIATVLKILTAYTRAGQAGVETVEINNWRRDYPGQTAEQKTREHAAARETNPATRQK